MRFRELHPWEVDTKEAIRVQEELKKRIITERLRGELRSIAGADVAYHRTQKVLYAGVLVFDSSSLEVVETATAQGKASFPYVPGLLSFREGPVLLEAFAKIKREPDVIIFDGQGIAHPRGVGIASHLGVILGKPSVGCAKSVLVGHYSTVPVNPGTFSYLFYKGKAVGVALRTRKLVKPVFVSPGHKIDLEGSIEIVLRSCKGYRLPEPLRQAHQLVNRLRVASNC